MEVIEKALASRPVDPPLSARLQQRIARDFTPRWNELWGGKCILHGMPAGPNAVRLDGNDYLGITGHPDIVGAQLTALRKDNEFVIQSGAFLLGDHPTHRAKGPEAVDTYGERFDKRQSDDRLHICCSG